MDPLQDTPMQWVYRKPFKQVLKRRRLGRFRCPRCCAAGPWVWGSEFTGICHVLLFEDVGMEGSKGFRLQSCRAFFGVVLRFSRGGLPAK